MCLIVRPKGMVLSALSGEDVTGLWSAALEAMRIFQTSGKPQVVISQPPRQFKIRLSFPIEPSFRLRSKHRTTVPAALNALFLKADSKNWT